MFKGAALFGLMFVFIAPQSREFVVGLVSQTAESLDTWAPLSYYTLGGLVALVLLSVILIKTWPQRADSANPMAKYRRQAPFDEN